MPSKGTPISLSAGLSATGIRLGCPISPVLFNIVLAIWATAITQEIKGIQIGNEEGKVPLFSYDVILHTENSKDATRNLLEFINEFGKAVAYKINTQKFVAFPYANKQEIN